MCFDISNKKKSKKHLSNLDILDLGCGGGLICEPLARLKAKVTGIDFVEENIKAAKIHASENNLNINYKGIQEKLDESNIKIPTIQDISSAVIKIRNQKLPDPNKIGNSGSFFKNPIVSINKIEELKSNFDNMPFYKFDKNKYKIPAAWLIEKAGFKGKTFGDCGVHKDQALVLVNYKSAKGSDILNLSNSIQKAVKLIFDIELEAEVSTWCVPCLNP